MEIGLLIGNNCILAYEPLNVIPSKGNGPFAVLLRHGWSVGSPVSREPTHPDAKNVNVNHITIREIESVKEIVTPQFLLDALALDFNEYNTGGKGVDGEGFSQEDKLIYEESGKGNTVEQRPLRNSFAVQKRKCSHAKQQRSSDQASGLKKKEDAEGPKLSERLLNIHDRCYCEGLCRESTITFSRRRESVVYSSSWGIPSEKTWKDPCSL